MDKSYKNVILPMDLHSMLKVLAAQRHMTMIQLVRQLVEKEVQNDTTNHSL